ncbi:MAG: hypothetical protein HYU29_02685 [Chloroflexi bacterium]|nr:hypothetical protein [Chloroflexota bacterium]
MPLRYRIYSLVREGNLGKQALFNGVVFGFGAGVLIAADLLWGSLETRWGLNVFMGFVAGFAALVIFNAVVEILGASYGSWKASHNRAAS